MQTGVEERGQLEALYNRTTGRTHWPTKLSQATICQTQAVSVRDALIMLGELQAGKATADMCAPK